MKRAHCIKELLDIPALQDGRVQSHPSYNSCFWEKGECD